MLNSSSKVKKVIAIVVALAVLVILTTAAVLTLDFYNSTVDDIEKYCTENSNKGATAFYLQSFHEFPDYIFAVPKNGNDNYGHELFYFKKRSFGTITRYFPEGKASGYPDDSVNSYFFSETIDGPQFLIFYSSNRDGAARLEYVTSYNENGSDIKTQITNSLSPHQPFITISKALKSDELLESVKLYDKNGKVIYEY